MNFSINAGGKILLFDRVKVMGIVNLTNDSFYPGSRIQNEKDLLYQVEKMLDEGADILDIGAYSSRPGAEDIPEEIETDRIIQALKSITKRFPEVLISVDTFRSNVLINAFEHGAVICNDISGGSIDEKMFETVSRLKMPYILMHMRGTPQTMKNLTNYHDIVLEMIEYFKVKIKKLNDLGQYDIILDPGFGFAKSISQNFYLLKQLHTFEIFELPILAGLSRKSMIYKTLNTDVENALNGTTALNMIALLNGAQLLRVHDVKEAKQTITLFENYIIDSIY